MIFRFGAKAIGQRKGARVEQLTLVDGFPGRRGHVELVTDGLNSIQASSEATDRGGAIASGVKTSWADRDANGITSVPAATGICCTG